MLTDIQVKRAEAKERDYKLYDQRGLYVLVTAKGTRSWRFKYRFDGKYRGAVLGRYPDMSLRDARDLVDELRQVLKAGRDPARHLRRGRLVTPASAETFETIARAWHELEKPHWRPVHAADVLRSLERDIFPDLGDHPMGEIDRPLLLAVLQKVTDRGAVETAHRIRQRCEAVFNHAISRGLHNDNPAIGLNGAMAKKPIGKLWPAITDIKELRQFLRDVDTAGASPITRAASRLLALTAQRPGMIRTMKWCHLVGIDWDSDSSPAEARWIIPAEEMKLVAENRADDRFSHEVPLVSAAVELLRAIRSITGSGDYVFWSSWRHRDPLSENAIAYLYKRLGYQRRHVPHGWRASFSTVMNELYADQPARGVSWDKVIDIMLAHIPAGVSASELHYNRAKYAAMRREVAQQWADLLLDGAVPVSRVVGGPRRPSPR